jgi:hypothetical protein
MLLWLLLFQPSGCIHSQHAKPSHSILDGSIFLWRSAVVEIELVLPFA